MSWFVEDLGFENEPVGIPQELKTKYDFALEDEFVEVIIMPGVLATLLTQEDEDGATTNTADISS